MIPLGVVAAKNQGVTTYKYPIMQARAAGVGTNNQRIALMARSIFSNAANSSQYILHQARVDKFFISTGAASGVGTAWTFTVRNNEVSTAITTTLADPTTSGSDMTNANIINAGNTLTVLQQNTGSAGTSTTPTRISLMTESRYQNLMATTGATITATTRMPLQGSANNATASFVQQVMPVGGTFRDLGVALGAAITSGDYTVTLYINGSPTALTRTQTSAAWGLATGSVSVAAGDLVHFEVTYNTPSANTTVMATVGFEASTPSYGVAMCANAISPATNTYNAVYGNNSWSATEAGMQMYALACRFKRLYVQLATAPGTSNSRTVTMRVNGSNTSLTVTVSGSSTSGFIDLDVDVVQGDLISFLHTTSGTPASSVIRFGVVHQVL